MLDSFQLTIDHGIVEIVDHDGVRVSIEVLIKHLRSVLIHGQGILLPLDLSPDICELTRIVAAGLTDKRIQYAANVALRIKVFLSSYRKGSAICIMGESCQPIYIRISEEMERVWGNIYRIASCICKHPRCSPI